MSQPLYPLAMRQARAFEVQQNWQSAKAAWLTAAEACPAESRESAYCASQAAACERILAQVQVVRPVERSPLEIAYAHIAGLRAMVKRLKAELSEARKA